MGAFQSADLERNPRPEGGSGAAGRPTHRHAGGRDGQAPAGQGAPAGQRTALSRAECSAGTAGGGSTFTITVTDSTTPGCTQTFQVTDPGNCTPGTPECSPIKCGTATIQVNGN